MLGAHVFDGCLGIEIKAVCHQCLCCLAMLAFLRKQDGTTNIAGNFRRRRLPARTPSGLTPEIFEAIVRKARIRSLTVADFSLKLFFPGGMKRISFE